MKKIHPTCDSHQGYIRNMEICVAEGKKSEETIMTIVCV